MKKYLIIFILILMELNSASALENESEHEHSHEEQKKSQVANDKGVLEAHEIDGIKLSKEAEEKFEIKRVKVRSLLIDVPKSTVLSTGLEKYVYRYRNGFYSRVVFVIKKKTLDKIQIQSNDLKLNDEIVTVGTGFIRIAELAAFDSSEGHSH